MQGKSMTRENRIAPVKVVAAFHDLSFGGVEVGLSGLMREAAVDLSSARISSLPTLDARQIPVQFLNRLFHRGSTSAKTASTMNLGNGTAFPVIVAESVCGLNSAA